VSRKGLGRIRRNKAALQAQANSQHGQNSAIANSGGQADVLMIRSRWCGGCDTTQDN
jgi:hypothetical protein